MTRSAFSAAILAIFVSSVAQAQAPPIRLFDVTVERHRTVAGIYDGKKSPFEGVRSVYVAPEGKVFATVRVTAAPAPGSDGQIKAADLWLTVAGQKLKCVGDQRGDGVAKMRGYVYAHFNPDARTIRMDPTFLVPEEAETGTFSIAGSVKELKLDVPIAPRIKAADAMQIAVKNVGLFAELPMEPVANGSISRRYAPAEGKLLVVTFAITPLVHNTEDAWFDASEDAFGLALADGAYASPVGAIRGNVVVDSPEDFFVTADASGKYRAVTISQVYVIPEKTRTASLCYFADPVAELKIPAKAR